MEASDLVLYILTYTRFSAEDEIKFSKRFTVWMFVIAFDRLPI